MPRERERKRKPRRQCAALPLAEAGGETLVMLVTSRETRRWVLPKGWAEKRLALHEAAAKEAFEEGGIVGATAASLWATGAIGVAVGLANYDVAVTVCLFTVLTLYVLGRLKPKERG